MNRPDYFETVKVVLEHPDDGTQRVVLCPAPVYGRELPADFSWFDALNKQPVPEGFVPVAAIRAGEVV